MVRIPIVVLTLLCLCGNLLALDASDLADYVGYYILDATNVEGDFEGADFGRVVQLDNGMLFEFQEYSYTYVYRPDVVILAKPFPESISQELQAKGVKAFQCASYVLIIDDEEYSVTRIR